MTDPESVKQENAEGIKNYLESEFKDFEVKFLEEIGRDIDHDMVSFAIRRESLKYLVKAHGIFLTSPVQHMANILKEWKLASEIRRVGESHVVIITAQGLDLEKK